jgi:hypothetical protein
MEVRKHLAHVRRNRAGCLPVVAHTRDRPQRGRCLWLNLSESAISNCGLWRLLGHRRYVNGPRLDHAGNRAGVRHCPGPQRVGGIASSAADPNA